MMAVLLGNKEHIGGWCFEGRVSEQQLVSVLQEVLDLVGLEDEEYVVTSSPTALRVTFPSIIGTSYLFSFNHKMEERTRVVLITAKRFFAYEVGKAIKEKLNLLMVGRGFFSY